MHFSSSAQSEIYDLFNAIPVSGHEHELFARYIKNNTEIEGKLFTPKAEIEGFENIDDLIRQYNAALYYKHTGRRLEEYKGHIYIKEYAEDSAEIIKNCNNSRLLVLLNIRHLLTHGSLESHTVLMTMAKTCTSPNV